MKLNENSETARIYRWFYGLEEWRILPNDGCEYFKKLALALLLFIPLGLVTLPITVACLIKPETLKPSQRIAYMVFLCILCLALFSMGCTIYMFFMVYDSNNIVFKAGVGGLILWFVAIVFALVEGVKLLREHIKNRKIKYDENGYRIWDEPKQDNLLVAFYKAKKEKYCPKLEWYSKK